MDFDFDEEATSGGDEAMDNELNEILDMIGHKCSICFIAESETELATCGDQFCYDCLEKSTLIEFQQHLRELQQLSFEVTASAAVDESLKNCQIEFGEIIPLSLLKQQLLNTITKNTPHNNNIIIPPASALVHYGVEVRHLPLSHQIPNSSKYISTKSWSLAREELKFSHCFERVLELRQTGSWSYVQETFILPPKPPHTIWDELLEEVWFAAKDFQQERNWKRSMAKLIAEEAIQTKNRTKSRKDNRFFYEPNRNVIKSVKTVYAPGSGLINSTFSTDCSQIKTMNLDNMDCDEIPTNINSPVGRLIGWNQIEDLALQRLVRLLSFRALNVITFVLNLSFHDDRPVRTMADIVRRYQEISCQSNSGNIGTCHNARIHIDHIQLMNSAATKLIVVKPSVTSKKLSMSAHPSHEAAARKANQNISKLFTPQELAMRRIQRTRLVADPTGALTTVPAGQRPPGSPGQINRPPSLNAVNYQAAIAAVTQQQAAMATAGTTAPRPSPPRPMGMVIPNAAIAQQQRQALLNRSHQIGNYISTMQTKPASSPLLRPPSINRSPVKQPLEFSPTSPHPKRRTITNDTNSSNSK